MSDARRDAHGRVTSTDVTDWWSTAIADIEPGVIRLRGFPIEQLINRASFVETIWLMLRGELPTPDEARLCERALVAAVDHGPQAPSIAAARMAATCGVGLHGAVSTGVGLLGDVHGGAGQQCMELLETIRRTVTPERRPGGDASSDGAEPSNGAEPSDGVTVTEAVARVLAELRRQKRYVPGFGHRFHPRDPRRDPLLDAAREHVRIGTISGRYLAIAEEIETQLSEGRTRPVPMNIDGATAVIYAELGFPAELGRGLFILSRSVGILAHAWEERVDGRRIKGPIPPPLLPTYVGEPPRPVPDAVSTAETPPGRPAGSAA